MLLEHRTGRIFPLHDAMKAHPAEVIPLRRLPAGCSARIARILGRPEHVHRLEEFGLRRGTPVEMFRSGNPCILRVDGNKICIRSDDFLNVLVEPTA
jgi:ferrous iron transport protein A